MGVFAGRALPLIRNFHNVVACTANKLITLRFFPAEFLQPGRKYRARALEQRKLRHNSSPAWPQRPAPFGRSAFSLGWQHVMANSCPNFRNANSPLRAPRP